MKFGGRENKQDTTCFVYFADWNLLQSKINKLCIFFRELVHRDQIESYDEIVGAHFDGKQFKHAQNSRSKSFTLI